MQKDSIGNRMKENYELRAKTYLTRRTPAILRLDGKCFHTFTKQFKRPFDKDLKSLMLSTTEYLCKNIHGAKLAYTQSDEISILLTDYDNLSTEAWFNYELQKMVSIAASLATSEFNKQYLLNKEEFDETTKLANFDCRAFNIPKEEVANYFIWRQLDWVRNSVQMLAQSIFSHKELHGKNQAEMKVMILKKGSSWEDCIFEEKYGNTYLRDNQLNLWTWKPVRYVITPDIVNYYL